jgi:hypothetical protein
MVSIRSYQKPEDAYLDAAYLGSMGIDADVVDLRGNGGHALGVAEPAIRIVVPDGQVSEAMQWLTKQGATETAVCAPLFESSWNTDTLHGFLKALLLFDLGCGILILVFGHVFDTPPPREVNEFLKTLAFSDVLWDFSYISYWPLFAVAIVSNVLCLFHSSTGRMLFAVTTVWGLITTLGPPPQIFGPGWGFIGSLQFTASNIALALMYWSPLRQRFDGASPTKS